MNYIVNGSMSSALGIIMAKIIAAILGAKRQPMGQLPSGCRLL